MFDIKTEKVEIYCHEEGKVVGHIDIVPGQENVLTWPFLLQRYTPASNDYRLSKGQVSRALQCPKCHHSLSLSGELRTNDRRPMRSGAIAQTSSEVFDVNAKPIIVGKTRVMLDVDQK